MTGHPARVRRCSPKLWCPSCRPVTEMHQTMVVTLLEEEAKKMDKALSRHHMMKIDEYSQTMANFPLPCMRHPQFFYPVAEFKYMVKNELD